MMTMRESKEIKMMRMMAMIARLRPIRWKKLTMMEIQLNHPKTMNRPTMMMNQLKMMSQPKMKSQVHVSIEHNLLEIGKLKRFCWIIYGIFDD